MFCENIFRMIHIYPKPTGSYRKNKCENENQSANNTEMFLVEAENVLLT